nr:zona pellucida protein AX 2 [Misgurnus anguillicaudatus]
MFSIVPFHKYLQKMVCFEIWVLWLVIVPATIIHGDTSADEINAECLGSRVQFTIHGSSSAVTPLEVYAVNDTQIVLITPYLAAQCGYTQKSDPWGNTIVSASLQSCFAKKEDGMAFTVAMQFKLYDFPTSSEKVHEVTKSCSHKMTSREIMCETNFMEVSVRKALPDKTAALKHLPTVDSNLELWKIILYTPEEKAFYEEDLLKMGYSVNSSPSRLVMRSPYNMAESFVERLADVDMIVFKSAVLYRDRWMMAIVEASAACPTNGATVVGQMIFWHVPLQIPHLMSSDVEILEVHLGVNGRRLTPVEMASHNYTMSFTESHIVIVIPIGSPDGYYKSHVHMEHYHISYTIEPMLEMLWKELLDRTTYQVLFPITTPLTPWQPQITDNTLAKQKMFDVLLGYFLPDVELLNITVGSQVLSISELISRGFGIQEHHFPNGTKGFSFRVSFSDPNVQKMNLRYDVTSYTLPLIFGFVILPEHATFLHSAVLEASLRDLVLPGAGGSCGNESFNIYVKYGNTPESQLKIILGERELNNDNLQQYNHHRNDTHFTIDVPLMSPDVIFESVKLAGVRGRLDLKIKDSVNDWDLKDLSLACPFYVPLLECLSNGTMTVILPKLESVPNLNPGELSLRDPACKPIYTEDHFAYFHFALNTCGTSRTFVEDTMKYENEVTWKEEPLQTISESLSEPYKQYRFTVSCIYKANSTQSVMFHSVPHLKEPEADVGTGELTVQLRLSQDMVYRLFYHDEDYPVLKFLKQPLYFEVGMDHSSDARIAVVLENCWATLTKDRHSRPRWDLIVDGCPSSKDPEQTKLLPVMADDRVHIPDHFKRFEVETFNFKDDGSLDGDEDVNMARRVFVHCDVILCHVENAAEGRCFQQCATPRNPNQASHFSRVRRRSDFTKEELQHVSTGPILLMG